MPKLTETFADKQPRRKRNGAVSGAVMPPPGAPLRIVEAHEPIRDGGWVPVEGTIVQWPAGQPQMAYSGPAGTVTLVDPTTHTNMTIPVVATEPQPLKVALVGTAPSSRMLAPYNDPSWKIWGCSPGNMNALPRYDAWFEIHANLMWPEHAAYGPQYVEWLKTLKVPVYMQDQILVPNATLFPWRELTTEFGEDFFTSSFAWMMAFAMRQGAAEIALYGIDMASRDEYILQRPGFFFFRHEARKRGIKVSAPNESDIMQSPPLYAISDSTPFGRKILAREKEIKERIAGMTGQRDQLTQNITYLQGALEDLDYFKSIWTGAQRPI